MNTAGLGNRLKEARARANLTQAELAAKVGVSRKTVVTVENRIFVPSALLALKLAQALDMRVDALFYIEEAS